ncbi:MAG: GIY-YIG nuclease family protein [Candidatus Odinarchaeota archaeon]
MNNIKEINSFDVLSEDKIKLYIYIIINEIEGKVYIGKTEGSIKDRWRVHKSRAKKIKKLRSNGKKIHAEHFINALIKYGFRIWKIYEIDNAYTIEELNEKEIYWIAYFRKTLGRKKVYNVHNGGKGGRNSDEILQKVSRIMESKWKDDDYKDKMSNNISKAMELKWKDDDYKDKMSKIFSKAMESKWEDDEFKNKISKAMELKWKEDEFKNKICKKSSTAMKSKWKDDEYKNKMSKISSKAMELRWKDDEFKNKMSKISSKAMKSRWKEYKKKKSKNGIFLEKPMDINQLKKDVLKLTIMQLKKKYSKCYTTIIKNFKYHLGINFRNLTDIRNYLKRNSNI